MLIHGKAITPWGEASLFIRDDYLVFLGFNTEENPFSEEPCHRYDSAAQSYVDQLLSGNSVPFKAIGTPFQESVWKILLTIPFGQTVSYEEVARRLGRPSAVRAVASAIGKNPISFLIPCHRVVHKNGKISQYRWGRDIKEKILAYEQTNTYSSFP